MSALPEQQRAVSEPHRERVETLGGLMSATAIFVAVLGMTNLDLSISGTHLEMHPIRVGVAAVVLALIAAGIGGRHRRLASVAVAVAAVAWFAGMVIAIVTERPIF